MSRHSKRHRIDQDTLFRYLLEDSELSTEEEEAIRAWMREQPEWRQLVHAKEYTEDPAIDWDTETELRRLRAKIEEHSDKAHSISNIDRGPSSQRGGRTARIHRLASIQPLRVAAALAFIVLSAVFVLLLLNESKPESSGQVATVVQTQKGERATYLLADGTRVHLNVDSRLTVTSRYPEIRELWLEGEAYFDVESDSTRPFVVHSGQAITRVLGTEFLVHATPDEGVYVVVAEGKVAFHRENAPSQGAVTITEAQMGKLPQDGRPVTLVADVDLQRYLAWMDGELVLDDATFAEVSSEIERWYDLSVLQVDSVPIPGHLNANFSEQQSLEEVLSVVAAAFGLSYEVDGRVVTFHSIGQHPP